MTVSSPNDSVRIDFVLRDWAAARQVPTYRVTWRDQTLVEESSLALHFARTGPLRSHLRVTSITRRTRDETYTLAVGKSSAARNHFREAVVLLEEQVAPRRRLELVFRAYDDGVAFRYRIPKQAALATFTIAAERSHFSFAKDCLAYALPLGGFTTSYEAYYQVAPLGELKPDALFAAPLLLEHPGGAWIAITEADLTDYAGMYLARLAPNPTTPTPAGERRESTTLVSRLSPWPGAPDVKVKASAPHESPWRVLQGGFRHVLESEFAPRHIGPQVMGTRSRMLAMYVVYENHLPMVADYPSAYRGQTGVGFVATVPVTWDETRVLNAGVGDFITIARRRNSDWYVGSMTDSSARELAIPLSFLPQGDFVAEIYADDPGAPAAPARVRLEKYLVTTTDAIAAQMAPAGGHAMHLTPASSDTRLPRYASAR